MKPGAVGDGVARRARAAGWPVVVAAGLLLWHAAVGSLVAAQAWPVDEGPMSAGELALLDAINRYRNEHGRPAWQPDSGLARVARSHSRAMSAQGRLSHEGFRQRAAATGSSLCVENLLRGRVPGDRAVVLWAQSPAHQANLLEPGARHAGIGKVGPFATMLACATPIEPLIEPEGAAPEPGPR